MEKNRGRIIPTWLALIGLFLCICCVLPVTYVVGDITLHVVGILPTYTPNITRTIFAAQIASRTPSTTTLIQSPVIPTVGHEPISSPDVVIIDLSSPTPTQTQEPTSTPQPTATPAFVWQTPTASALTMNDIERNYSDLTDIQWNDYSKSIIGQRVHWRGTVDEVYTSGTINVDVGQDYFHSVFLDGVPKDIGKTLQKDSVIEFEATIHGIYTFLGLTVSLNSVVFIIN